MALADYMLTSRFRHVLSGTIESISIRATITSCEPQPKARLLHFLRNIELIVGKVFEGLIKTM